MRAGRERESLLYQRVENIEHLILVGFEQIGRGHQRSLAECTARILHRLDH